MYIKSTLTALLLALSPCGAVTTFTFEQDDADGIALRITGSGQPTRLFAYTWPNYFSIHSPSGLWSFPYINLAARFIEPEVLIFYFDVVLRHRDYGGMQNHPFNEYFLFGPDPFGSPENPIPLMEGNTFPGIMVAEGFEFRPEELVDWHAENTFRIDSRPSLMDPDTWGWTFYSSLVRPERVPEMGSTLAMLAFALGGLGFLRRNLN